MSIAAGPWTAAEDSYLREHYGRRPVREISPALARSHRSIFARARRLGLEGLRQRAWTPEDDDYLRRHRGRKSAAAIGRVLGRAPTAVQRQAGRLGAYRHPHWTAEEEAYLEAHWASDSTDKIAERMGRTRGQVEVKASRMGLRRRPPLSPEAEELLWEMRETPGVVEYFAEHFGQRVAVIDRVLERLEEAGGPDAPPP